LNSGQDVKTELLAAIDSGGPLIDKIMGSTFGHMDAIVK
jgi:hypothetical protein